MASSPAGKFSNPYVVFGIERTASNDAIHKRYQELVKLFHPQKGESPDAEQFKAINDAYEVLTDPYGRKTLDDMLDGPQQDKSAPVFLVEEIVSSLPDQIGRRSTILAVLYDRRRQKPNRPGVSFRNLEMMLGWTPDQLELTLWYLKQRELVTADDKSNLLVTANGMDYMENHTPTLEAVMKYIKPKAAEAETAEETQAAVTVATDLQAIAEATKPPSPAKPAEPLLPGFLTVRKAVSS